MVVKTIIAYFTPNFNQLSILGLIQKEIRPHSNVQPDNLYHKLIY
jgi:hypothetical protein